MDITKEEELTLATLRDGAAVEAFDRVLKEDIIPNIIDPNTKADAVREITMKVQFKPDEQRFHTVFGIEVFPSKLAKQHRFYGHCIVDVGRHGQIVAKEMVSTQQNLFKEPETQETQEESQGTSEKVRKLHQEE